MEPLSAIEAFYASVKPKSVLIALSGGPDSVALLCASCQVFKQNSVSVHACWVNHGLRPETELSQEEQFVTELCDELSVPLHKMAIERGKILDMAKVYGGVEAAARHFRYKSLEHVRQKIQAQFILTGHNADDFIETLIMRFCTGSGTAGLRGIQAEYAYVHRPFLKVKKVDILLYLKAINRKYSIDSTNQTDDFSRNRVRHNTLPALLKDFPSLYKALYSLAEKTTLDEEALSQMAEKLLCDGSINAETFDESPAAVRIRAIYKLAQNLGFADKRLPWKLIAAAAKSDKKAGRLASGSGISIERVGNKIIINQALGSKLSRRADEDNKTAYTNFSFVANGLGEYQVGMTSTFRLYSSNIKHGIRLDAFTWPLCVSSKYYSKEKFIILEDIDGTVARIGKNHTKYRSNDSLKASEPNGFMICEFID